MKILLTGYRGFIGKNMLPILQKDHEVSLMEWGDKLPSLKGFDWVIHLGANSSTTETNLDLIMEQNLFSSIRILEECIEHGVNLQYASSASVYGKGSVFQEDTPCSPLNHYALSKYLFEQYVKSRDTSNIVVQGFRYFNVFGPHEEHKGKQASPFTQFRRQAVIDREIVLWRGSQNFKRDFIHVNSVIDYHLRFFDVKESGVWNIGTGETRSFQDIAWEIYVEESARIRYIDVPNHILPHYQTYTCADLTKLKKTLNEI
jgi:ADP-L-glycero-D-manno-heptose 6-epimerase